MLAKMGSFMHSEHQKPTSGLPLEGHNANHQPALPKTSLLGLLQLIGPLDGVSLILGPPLCHLTVGFGQASLQLRLGLLLLLILLPQELAVMACRLQTVGQGVLGLKRTTQ